MAYPKVLFNSAIQSLANPQLDPEAASILIRTKAVVPAIKQAVANHKVWATIAKTKQDECKKLLVTTTEKVKTMQEQGWVPNPFTIEEVKGSVKIIETVASYLNDQNKEYSVAFDGDGFRAYTLSNPMVKAFPQLTEKHAEELATFAGQARSKIIEEDRGLVAIRGRINEYVTRAGILVKAAEAAQAKAFGRSVNRAEALDKAIVAAKGYITSIEKDLTALEKKHATLEKLLKTPVDKKTEPFCKGVAAERAETLKSAKGTLKTLDQELKLAEETLKEGPELARQYKAPLGNLRMQASSLDKKIETFVTKEIPAMNKIILLTLKVKL